MSIKQALLMELEHEAANTRKVLERIPTELFSYKPHEKNFTMGRLATHLAELPGWMPMTLQQDEMDFAKMDYKPVVAETTEALLQTFDKNLEQAREALKEASDEQMMEPWTMRKGEQIFFTMPKASVLRSFVMNHSVHHRAQLGLYLRLNNIPVPGMYGPTADEN